MVMFMKAVLNKGVFMVKGNIPHFKVEVMKESGNKEWRVEKEGKLMKMEESMKDSLKKIKNTGKEHFCILMEVTTLVSSFRAILMVKEWWFGLIEENTREHGRLMKWTEKEFLCMKMAASIWVNLYKARSKVGVGLSGLMGRFMMEIGGRINNMV
jgi:hypothetical protein